MTRTGGTKIRCRVQELENLTISELPPLRLGFLVSRRYEERQEQELLQELPWLQMRFQNRANFEAMIDANMRPCSRSDWQDANQ